jgi:hypothetical protein
MSQTPDQKQKKRPKISPTSMARSELAERFHSLFHFLPEIDLSFLERELVPRLALGDPVLVVEWSDAGLQAACARETAPDNPANCKDTLIQIMTSPTKWRD